ncbi:phosphoribosylformylglycinamidine synthase subunit PurS [bacterium]|jgi:phosphoribosylformylglycinamidine synthase|nr:phosphoribosylformylglycinamidine synthase subunit PurS [bacterium]
MKATINITLKSGVLDPQGKAIENALGQLNFSGVNSVRQGKLIEIDLSETDAAKAEASLTAMCEQLLANTVIENYDIQLDKSE